MDLNMDTNRIAKEWTAMLVQTYLRQEFLRVK